MRRFEGQHQHASEERRRGTSGMIGLLMLGVILPSPYATETTAQTRPHGALQITAPVPVALPRTVTEREVRLSLEEAIRLALQNNLDIERERLGPQVAHTQVGQARAVFDPSVGLTAGLGQTKTLPQNESLLFDQNGDVSGITVVRPFEKISEVTPNFTQKIITGSRYELRFVNLVDLASPAQSGATRRIANPRYESALELVFTQPLLKDFGIAVNTAPIRQAHNDEEKAQQSLLLSIMDTVFAVQQGYWELVFSIGDLAAKRESQKLAEDFYAENKIRVELGALAPIELVQAETQAKVRQGEVITAAAAVREAEDKLKETLNLPETMGTWRLRLLPTDSPPFVPVTDIPIDEKITLALQNRPEVRQVQLDVASTEIERDVARNKRLPQLDLESRASVGGFGKEVGKTFSNISDADGYNWALMLRLAYPLGNRAARSEVQRQQLLLQQALINLRKTQRTVAREIFQTVRELETASQQVEVRRAATVLARTQLEAEQEKFRLGLSTSFNVLQFQSQLTTERSAETRALSEYNVALAKLDRVTGTMQYGVK